MTLHHVKPSKRRVSLWQDEDGSEEAGLSYTKVTQASDKYLAPAFAPSLLRCNMNTRRFINCSDSWIALIEPEIQGLERWVLYCLDTTAAKQNIRGAATASNEVYEA